MQRTPTNSASKGHTGSAANKEYPGSSRKHGGRQSLRTPQQHIPLTIGDRVKNRRASRSYVLLDQSNDLETPRANIEAFMNVTDTTEKTQHLVPRLAAHGSSSLLRERHDDEGESAFRKSRVNQLIADTSKNKSLVSSPMSKLTPRTNIWNLLQTGIEGTPIEPTQDLSASNSPLLHKPAEVKYFGQRVSVSPIRDTITGAERKQSNVYDETRGMAARKSFHLDIARSSDEAPAPNSPQSSRRSGQRVSVSPINVSDNRAEGAELTAQSKIAKASRRSFHLDVPQAERRNGEDGGEVVHYTDGTEASPETDSLSEEFRDAPNIGDDGVRELYQSATAVILQTPSIAPVTEELSPTQRSFTRPVSASKHTLTEVRLSTLQPLEFIEPNGEDDVTDGVKNIGQSSETNERNSSTDIEKATDGHAAAGAETQKRQEESSGDTQNSGGSQGHGNREKAINDGDSLVEEQAEEEAESAQGQFDDLNIEVAKEGSDFQLKDNGGISIDRPKAKHSWREDIYKAEGKSVHKENLASAIVDPASVYDLSGSSDSPDSSKTREGSPKKRKSSQKKKTSSSKRPGASTYSGPSSSKRQRLNFSRMTPQSKASPVSGGAESPRSSTPLVRTRRIFNSTKIQRSVTEFLQSDQELAVTPTVKNLFSDISPIRPTPLSEAPGAQEMEEEDAPEVNSLPNSKTDLRGRSKTNTNAEDDGSQGADDDLPSFSSMVTPHIDLRKRVLHSVTPLKKSSTKSVSLGHPKVPKEPKQPKTQVKKSRKAPSCTLPRRSVKYFAELQSTMKLSVDAIEEIEKVSEQFWEDTFKALEAYALHAGRKTVKDEDVILLMKTQRLITGTDDLHNKIRQLLPMELRAELIPCAYTGAKK